MPKTAAERDYYFGQAKGLSGGRAGRAVMTQGAKQNRANF